MTCKKTKGKEKGGGGGGTGLRQSREHEMVSSKEGESAKGKGEKERQEKVVLRSRKCQNRNGEFPFGRASCPLFSWETWCCFKGLTRQSLGRD